MSSLPVPIRGLARRSCTNELAGLLMSEAKYEVSQVQKTLFIGLFDVQSAFDVVQHIILMDKLFDQKIPLPMWSIIDDMYKNNNLIQSYCHVI
jgi:hypothetical protein